MNLAIGEAVSALGWALLHFLWQGALVGIVAAAALALLRGARAQARYLVGCLALIACLLLPVASVLRLGTDADESTPAAHSVSAATPALPVADAPILPAFTTLVDTTTLRDRLQPRLPLIVAMWSLGAALLALRMGFGLVWIARAGGAGRGRGHVYWQAQLDTLAARMALPRRVLLRVVDDLDVPAAARWLRPVVLVPAALVARMPPQLLEALLAHELAHVRRHDYLVNLLQGAIEALLFYHPVVWWLSRQVRIERELIADDLAARALGDPRRLALALDALAGMQPRPDPTLTLALAADGGNLMTRIQHLVRPRHASPGWKAALPVIAISVLCLSLAQANPEPAANDSVVQSVLDTPAASDRIRGTMTIDSDHDSDDDGYALLDADDANGLTYLQGSMDDLERLREMRRNIDTAFLWVRRDHREFVSSDPQLLATVQAAWKSTEPVGAKMEALGDQMEGHGKVMEEIGKRMEAQAGLGEDDAADMEKLAREMSVLAVRQAEMAAMDARTARDYDTDDSAAARDEANKRQREMAVEQDQLNGEMAELSRQMEQHSAAMERTHAPMEAMGREMEHASKPMEALGKQMEVLGAEMERLSEEADRTTRAAIDEAIRDGKLVPIQTQAAR